MHGSASAARKTRAPWFLALVVSLFAALGVLAFAAARADAVPLAGSPNPLPGSSYSRSPAQWAHVFTWGRLFSDYRKWLEKQGQPGRQLFNDQAARLQLKSRARRSRVVCSSNWRAADSSFSRPMMGTRCTGRLLGRLPGDLRGVKSEGKSGINT